MRFTTAHLGALVGITAIILAAVFGSSPGVFWLLTAAFFVSLATPLGRRTQRWTPIVLALAFVAINIPPPVLGLDYLLGIIVLGLCALAGLSMPRVTEGRYDRRFLVLWAAAMFCIASVPVTRWPLRLAFALSRPNLEGLARRMEAGARPAGPMRVGAFSIEEAEMRDGRPCFWTSTNPSGFSGLVRNPRAGVNPAAGRQSNLAFNLWSYVEMDADWAYVEED